MRLNRRKNAFPPLYTILPGETLAETLEAMGMTPKELARRIGQPGKIINEILNGEAAISQKMALALDQALGVPASFWINLEKNYHKNLSCLRGEKNGQD